MEYIITESSMSNTENNDDSKIHVESKLHIVKELNGVLSIENAAAVRIASRIDTTPIEGLKEILKRHLDVTNIQKIRLQDMIRQFGGKPTDTKADLLSSFVSTTTTATSTTESENSLSESLEKEEQNKILKRSTPQDYEIVLLRQDFAINHDELMAYESLIENMQVMDIPHKQENISILEKSMKEEELMVYWYKTHTPLILDSLWPKVIHSTVRRGQNYLLDHIRTKIPIVIIYADLVGSTQMSMTLPIDNLVSIVRIFDYHISNVVDTLGGYVLKYAGDAVISFFPSRVDNQNKYLSSDTAVESGKLMIKSIQEEVNSFMHKIYKYPELSVKIGIDAGENAIVQFGYDQHSPIDILGYGMNVASKIMSVTGANKVSVGENVYKSLNPELQNEFHELTITDRWKYVNYGTDRPYKIYTLNT
ncbi:adenylate/guanylate cyclase domain-containing protein [Candidatus Nitrosocosmicus sp. R]